LTKVAIFSSGAAETALVLLEKFQLHMQIQTAFVLLTNPEEGAIEKFSSGNLPLLEISEAELASKSGFILDEIQGLGVDFVLLADAFPKIPEAIISAFPAKILGIRTELPEMTSAEFGEEVIAANARLFIQLLQAGEYFGEILFKLSYAVGKDKSTSDIAARVIEIEKLHYPLIAAHYILKTTGMKSRKKHD
jgi:folate-dependent phosphoribosylglycinamide formyltransferase PurN